MYKATMFSFGVKKQFFRAINDTLSLLDYPNYGSVASVVLPKCFLFNLYEIRVMESRRINQEWTIEEQGQHLGIRYRTKIVHKHNTEN